MQLTHHPSGLLVPAQDERAIERELRRLDDRLFLSWEIDPRYKERVYRVLCWVAGDVPPMPVCDWRDQQQRPLPLSSALVDLVRSLAPRGGVAAQEALRANEELQQRVEREFEYELDEIVADLGPRLRETRSALLPRGQHLRRSRDKRRARGENV